MVKILSLIWSLMLLWLFWLLVFVGLTRLVLCYLWFWVCAGIILTGFCEQIWVVLKLVFGIVYLTLWFALWTISFGLVLLVYGSLFCMLVYDFLDLGVWLCCGLDVIDCWLAADCWGGLVRLLCVVIVYYVSYYLLDCVCLVCVVVGFTFVKSLMVCW